jgi:pyruvate dehydrogenase E2 component (dihydrolipoamide acetyltransferase)
VVEVTLPQLGESVTEGVIAAWLVAIGDVVRADQPLAEVSTDKVDTAIPSPVAGTVAELRAEVDATVRVGEVIAVIRTTDAADGAPPAPAQAAPAPAQAAPAPAQAAPAPPPVAVAPAPAAAAPPGGPGRVTSPLVRRELRRSGVSPARAAATGPGGRLTRSDVARAAQAGSEAIAAPGTVVPVSRVRRAIAAAMTSSLATAAQLTSVVEADVSDLMALRADRRDAFRSRHGLDLSPLPLIARAVCRTLTRHPRLNASIDLEAGTIVHHADVNLGIAVDTDRGLLVPNLKRAQLLDVTGLALGIADVAERARSRRLLPDDVAGGTFTLTNTGSRGTLFDTPILNPPEVAILGTGLIERRPVVDPDGAIVARWRVHLALTYDHRLVDGADAARFLTDVRDALGAPELVDELPV